MKPIDSHAHLLSEAFDTDREALLLELPQHVKAVIECASSSNDFAQVRALVDSYGYIYGAVGIHPECVDECKDIEVILLQIEKLLQHKKIVALGEIGLDYYWEPEKAEAQKQMLRAQLDVATDTNMPVILHNRDAAKDLLGILRAYKGLRGVIHCFTEGPAVLQQVLDLGLYIGIGGIVTFKNAGDVLEAAKVVPLERLLIETDSPYLAPAPMRGKRNNPAYVQYVAEFIAQLRGISVEELINIANQNVKTLFGLDV